MKRPFSKKHDLDCQLPLYIPSCVVADVNKYFLPKNGTSQLSSQGLLLLLLLKIHLFIPKSKKESGMILHCTYYEDEGTL